MIDALPRPGQPILPFRCFKCLVRSQLHDKADNGNNNDNGYDNSKDGEEEDDYDDDLSQEPSKKWSDHDKPKENHDFHDHHDA